MRLSRLSVECRSTFAAACAERLRPYYGYPDSPPIPAELNVALEALWSVIHGQPAEVSLDEAGSLLDSLPEPDEDAIAAALWAIDAYKNNDPQAAVWAARRAYEARDRLVVDSLHIRSTDPMWEDTVLAHPVVQEELRRQVDDLEALSISAASAPIVVSRARMAGTKRGAA